MPARTFDADAGLDALALNGALGSARQAIDMVCDRWTLSIVLALLPGPQRFKGLTERTGVASRLLAARLKALEDGGVLRRSPYDLRPPRFDYRLTDMGAALAPVFLHMHRWERAWDARHPPNDLVHLPCGATLRTEVRCRACGRRAGAHDITLEVRGAELQPVPEKTARHRRSTVSSRDRTHAPQLLGPCLDIFGDKWGIEILLCAFSSVRRFNDFKAATGIAANILSDRLDRLVAADLLSRGRDAQISSDYRLTPEGLDTYAIMVAIRAWADTWVRRRFESPIALIHAACGQIYWPDLACVACDRRVSPDDVDFGVRPPGSDAPK